MFSLSEFNDTHQILTSIEGNTVRLVGGGEGKEIKSIKIFSEGHYLSLFLK